MINQIVNEKPSIYEQRFLLPRRYNWQEFKAIQTTLQKNSQIKITFLDGWIELMTLGEEHETIKSIIALLLGLYFLEKEIEFIPVGSSTREAQEKGVSFEPDESYYIGEKKENPDFAIEVNLTSGSIKKLEKYKRFKIAEVWLWENNQILIYCFRERENYQEYEKVEQSELFTELNLDLFIRCVLMPSKLEAMKIFNQAIKKI
ncbi:hypothetical protein C7H19_07135 [Aphanothece hegewaldii CCALA 016]|uniref:Putative restriction endonuclease domain-containing protein n=1 Tax=Aphanothece hegewaldii CCALA 016 TaxID=2107694 RepID=A0A2T1M0N6_9CHRO|nr:Uma2 family endonuclease [Aphanothece hegewaldii]PSF38236.1 hypothetical protein C7H19_07135 [Aphanothece hegewaldii CCALA 016]